MTIELLFSYLIQIFCGYFLADFIMGIYHWIKDTYFSPFTFIIGKLFIWGSRLHHIRPRYVLDFSDLELFLDSAKWTAVWIIPLMIIFKPSVFLVSLFLTISLNDVVHKYAHMFDHERPKWITFLQKIYILQSHEEHHLHHIHPHQINYCPITPYLNLILEKINFWRRFENIIQHMFGVEPRSKEHDFIEDANYPAGIKFVP